MTASRQRTTAGRTRRAAAVLGTVLVVALAPTGTSVAQTPDNTTQAKEDLARWVNPFVGTKPGGPDHGTGGGAGNNFPGADVPFGMVQWSPDTVKHQHGGYFYDDTKLKGFSLTHLSGAGCSTYQDIPIMPYVGEVTTSPATDPGRYAAGFSHANESATPGYYGVKLDSGAKVDLTVTQRTGLGKFAYPAGGPATLLVNTSGSIAGTDDAEVSIGTDSISGWAASGRFCGAGMNRYRVYFHAQFDRKFASVGTWKDGSVTHGRTLERGGANAKVDLDAVDAPKTLPAQQRIAEEAKQGKVRARSAAPPDTTVSGPGSGGFVTFDTLESEQVQMRVGLSFVSLDGAKNNLKVESGKKSFDTIAAAARSAWNDRLNTIAVKGGTDAQRTTFYTALYHSLLQPNVFSDADGKYKGFDGRIRTAEKGHAIYSNFSGWDVYRSEMQLLATIAPKEASDMSRSMIAFAEQGGSWDRWTVANSYTGVMVGDPYHIMVASSYAFGAKDFDAQKALLLMLRGATQKTQGYEERPGLDDYQKLGYVANGAPNTWGPPATTLEYTSADFSIADLARRLGDGATYNTFMKRSQYWQNLFNPGTGYIQARNRDGSFAEPFDPASSNGWVEGNAAQYTWMVPYNPRGLFNAMGGDAEVIKRLDFFFKKLNAGPNEPHAFLGNEPIMHALWLYNYAGAPYKTQAITRTAVNDLFGPGPNGLMGNDDLGQMSSWYVWAAMGMYPVVPGRAELVLNSPLFSEITVTRPGGVKMVIRAPGASAKAQYVTGLKVNGRISTRSWLPESFVERGGTLDYTLSETADPTWGSQPADLPPSFRDGEIGQRGFVNPGRLVVKAGGSESATIGAQDFSGAGAKVRWAAEAPAGLTLTPSSGEVTVPAGGKVGQPVTLAVAATTAEGNYRIPVTFTASDGTALSGNTLQVLVAEPGSLRAAYNNVGISPDDNPGVASYDGSGWSYSRNALEVAGVRSGGTVTVDGLNHKWPAVPIGEADNAAVSGQTVKITAPGATKLALIGSATNGKSTGKLTISFTDGTTQVADVGFCDWALGGGGQPIEFENRVVAKTPYRNKPGGAQTLDMYLFATKPIELTPGKEVASVTLPSGTQGGLFHVFTVTAG